MLYATREANSKICIYDSSDDSVEWLNKTDVIEAMETMDIEGIDEDGSVTGDVVIELNWEQCNWLQGGGNIWEHGESIVETGSDDNDFSIYKLTADGVEFDFKETHGRRLLFKSNLLVTITDELLDIIRDLLEE